MDIFKFILMIIGLITVLCFLTIVGIFIVMDVIGLIKENRKCKEPNKKSMANNVIRKNIMTHTENKGGFRQ